MIFKSVFQHKRGRDTKREKALYVWQYTNTGPQVDRIAGLPAHTRSPALNVFLAEVPGHGTGNDVDGACFCTVGVFLEHLYSQEEMVWSKNERGST